jgi:regulatory protein
LRLLSLRAHSRTELSRKLLRRGFEEGDVQGALERLGEVGYLDDLAFADGYVRRRSARVGPRALASELARRGVGREIASQALAGLSHQAQLMAAVKLIHRSLGRNEPATYKELLDRVGTRLLRRGFSEAIARKACQAVWRGTASTPDP